MRREGLEQKSHLCYFTSPGIPNKCITSLDLSVLIYEVGIKIMLPHKTVVGQMSQA